MEPGVAFRGSARNRVSEGHKRVYARLRRATDPARQALPPVCEELAARIGRKCPRRKRGPRPKIAAVERREPRTPDRKGVQRRLASALACLASTPWVPRKHPAPSRRSAPLIRGANASHPPGAIAPREREGSPAV